MTRYEKLNLLYNEEYRIIDFLPKRVDADAGSFYEEVEQYFLRDRQLQEFCGKTIAVVLKLLCYYSFDIYIQDCPFVAKKKEGWLKDKRCDTVVKLIRKVIMKKKGQIDILLHRENAIVSITGGLMSIAVYHESESLKRMIDRMAETEGFYCWQ